MQRPEQSQPDLAWLSSRSGMAQAVRVFDWASTPLGPISGWPVELCTAAGLVLESGFPKALMWGPSLTTLYNDAFRPILGDKPEALGRSFREVWAEAWDVLAPMADRAFAGTPTFIENFELTIERYARPETAWFTFCYHPVRMRDGSVGGVMDTVIESTAMLRAQHELEFLRDELAHRLKNTLAMVQAIARQTFGDNGPTMDAFEARLQALGAAHGALQQQNWAGSSIPRIVDSLLALHGDRFEIAGADLPLGPRTTVTLTLILHELATNAVKYGALSTPAGRILLHWHVDAEDLLLRWRELGGPPVAAPAHRGFGSRLIDMGLSGSSRVERRYPAAGVEVDLWVPRADLRL